MDYRLDLLDDDRFEQLVNTICQNILGTGIISFSKGRDGGRDGKFEGVAENYPSQSKKWSGKFIIQSKHTSNPIASCSETDFVKTIEKIEIPKIINLKKAKEIDNYLVFTNRKLSGDQESKLVKLIKGKTKVKNIAIIGKETINDLYLNNNRNIVLTFELDKHHIPFDFSNEEIEEIILEFRRQFKPKDNKLRKGIDKIKYDFSHIEKEEKNKKNNLSDEYYKNVILSSSLSEFSKIQEFLDNPINSEIKDLYFDIASELNQLITLKRNNYHAFEEIFVFIYKKICDGSSIMKKNKRFVSIFLHYMYAECLIGKK